MQQGQFNLLLLGRIIKVAVTRYEMVRALLLSNMDSGLKTKSWQHLESYRARWPNRLNTGLAVGCVRSFVQTLVESNQ